MESLRGHQLQWFVPGVLRLRQSLIKSTSLFIYLFLDPIFIYFYFFSYFPALRTYQLNAVELGYLFFLYLVFIAWRYMYAGKYIVID